MGKYRNIYTEYWQDSYITSLEPLEKYFYIYLMTNSKATQSGCYEIVENLIIFETGLTKKQVSDMIEKFVRDKKIMFNKENNEFLLLNWCKHNNFKNSKIKIHLKKEVERIKTKEFKEFIAKKIGDDTLKETNEKDLMKAKEIAEKKGVENVEAYAKAMVNNGFTSNSETEDERRTKIILKKELRDLEERKEILKDKLEPENAARINELKKILQG